MGSLCRKADCAGCALGPLICLMCVDRPEARGSEPRAPSPRPVLVMQAGRRPAPPIPPTGPASSEMLLTCLLNFVFPRC